MELFQIIEVGAPAFDLWLKNQGNKIRTTHHYNFFPNKTISFFSFVDALACAKMMQGRNPIIITSKNFREEEIGSFYGMSYYPNYPFQTKPHLVLEFALPPRCLENDSKKTNVILFPGPTVARLTPGDFSVEQQAQICKMLRDREYETELINIFTQMGYPYPGFPKPSRQDFDPSTVFQKIKQLGPYPNSANGTY